MYRNIIAQSPEMSHGYGGLGGLYFDAGEYAEAAEFLSHAVELNPHDFKHLHNLGLALVGLGRLDEARAVGETGVQRFPGMARFLKIIALSSMDNDPPRATEAVLTGLSIDPKDTALRDLLRTLVTTHPAHDDYRRLFTQSALEPRFSAARSTVHELLPADPVPNAP